MIAKWKMKSLIQMYRDQFWIHYRDYWKNEITKPGFSGQGTRFGAGVRIEINDHNFTPDAFKRAIKIIKIIIKICVAPFDLFILLLNVTLFEVNNYYWSQLHKESFKRRHGKNLSP